jgi:hypothetical protein
VIDTRAAVNNNGLAEYINGKSLRKTGEINKC